MGAIHLALGKAESRVDLKLTRKLCLPVALRRAMAMVRPSLLLER